MADCNEYINCDNNHLTTPQLLRSLVTKTITGCSALRVLKQGAVNNYIVATGGVMSQVGNWKVHQFLEEGTHDFNVEFEPENAYVWLMEAAGGGGGAGGQYGGSGGAGGYINKPYHKLSNGAGTYQIVVGNKGIGGANVNSSLANGTKGGNSSFDGIIASGGGAGIRYTADEPSLRDGGSGGSNFGFIGAGNSPSLFPPQGNNSGTGAFLGGHIYQGAGGGAMGVGDPGTNAQPAIGGLGIVNYITGSAVTYCTGGIGSWNNANGVSGAANTGDGGQGAGILSGTGGDGGSGIVVIAYYSPVSDPGTIGNPVTFSYDSSDFDETYIGGLTSTYSPGNSIRLQGTNFNNNNNHVFLKNYLSDSANVVFQCNVKFDSLLATDFGASLRIFSTIAPSFVLRVGAATGVNKGSVQVFQNNNLLQTFGTLPSLNIGDIVNLKITILDNAFTVTVTNGAGVVSGTHTYDYDFTFTPVFVPPLYTFAFGSSGGDYTFSNASAVCTDKKQADLVITGDSRSGGLFAGGNTPANRVSNLWKSNNPTKTVYNLSGSGESMSNLISRLPEIINYAPKRIIICMVINDLIAGQTDNQVFEKMKIVINELESRGIACFIQESPACNFVNQSGANALIANYWPDRSIPEPPTWDIVNDNTADDIHWNAATAQAKIYNNQTNYITL